MKDTGKNKKLLVCTCVTACLLALLLNLPAGIRAYAEPGDLGEPLSSYDMGSAKKLKGKNVIISFFVDSMYLRWDDEEKLKTLEKLSVACSFLEDEAKKSDTELEFIYDWTENDDIAFTGRVFFPIDEDTFYDVRFDNRIDSWLKYKVSYDGLLKEYDADNIAMIIFFRENERSYAICYDGEDRYEETLILFDGSNAAIYAHELLHLYGAHDLYHDAEYTDKCVDYIKSRYPNELMLTVKEKSELKITKEISPITAYHIGWLDAIEETYDFPELKR